MFIKKRRREMPKTYISDSRCNSLICLWELHNMTSFPHFLLKLNQTWSKVSLLSSCKSECTTPVFWNPATTFLSLSFLSTSALNFLSLSVPFFQPLPPSPFPTSARLLNPEWATFVSSKEAITDVTSRLAGCHFSTSPPPGCISHSSHDHRHNLSTQPPLPLLQRGFVAWWKQNADGQ